MLKKAAHAVHFSAKALNRKESRGETALPREEGKSMQRQLESNPFYDQTGDDVVVTR